MNAIIEKQGFSPDQIVGENPCFCCHVFLEELSHDIFQWWQLRNLVMLANVLEPK